MRKDVSNVLDTIDVFGFEANQFSFRRRARGHTCVGTTASIGLIIFMLIFASIRLYLVIEKPNPDISVFEERDKH
jgi:hypothetical protein